MSLVSLGAPFACPLSTYQFDRGGGLAGIVLDADGEKTGMVFDIPKTGTLCKIGILNATITSADVLKVSLQTVDASSGQPSGILYDANAYGTYTPALAGGVDWVGLNGGSGVSVTAGDLVAVVIEFNSYVSGNMQLRASVTNAGNYTGRPYGFSYLGSTWAFLGAKYPDFGIEYATGEMVYAPLLMPAVYAGATAFNSTSDPNIRALKFELSYNCRISHLFVVTELDANATIVLYGPDGVTPLISTVLDTDVRGNAASGFFLITLAAPILLNANAAYRLALVATESTPNINIYTLRVSPDGLYNPMDALEFGQKFIYSSCNGAPDSLDDWTDDNTYRPLFGVIVDQIEMGGASGGGRRPRGGYRGVG